MQIPSKNNPPRSHHARRQKWFRFLTLAACLLLPVKLQATTGDPIPGIDVSLDQIPGGIVAGFKKPFRVRFGDLVGDAIGVDGANALYEVSTNTSFQVTAANVPGGQIVIVKVDGTNDFGAMLFTALGVATVNIVSNQIWVENIGESGQDGIAKVGGDANSNGSDTRSTNKVKVSFAPVDVSGAGAQLAFATVGEVNGTSNVVAGSLSLSNRAPGRLRVRSDVSGVGATQVVVSVYLAGALVGSTVMADGDLGDLAPAMELSCADDKSVACGEAWSFDLPTVITNACGDPNVTFTVLSTATNSGPCPLVTTRTWLVGDTCGNTNTCSQTVTVNCCTNPCPPAPLFVFNTGVGADGVVLADEAVDPHYGLVTNPNGGGSDAFVVSSLPGGWLANTAASKWIGPTTNGMGVGEELTDPYVYQLGFNVPCTSNAIISGRWAADDAGSILLNGNPTPVATLTGGNFSTWHYFAITSGLLAGPNRLDFYVTNSGTGPTGLRVELSGSATCCTNPCIILTCGTNKTVECGSAWSFDVPTNIVDTCCTSYTLSSSDLTNGFCPQVITRTWAVTDLCGNTNTCSQTVTMMDTTPPSLTCSGNKAVQCGDAWTFDAPGVTDSCSGTNVTFTFSDTTNGVCPQILTRTWSATDLCGNSSACTQTVTVVSTTLPVFTNCPPPALDLGCNPTNIPDCDPNVRAIDGCGLTMAPAYLLVSSFSSADVKRYDATTGAFIDTFTTGGSVNGVLGLGFGPDDNLYVSSYYTSEVKRYNGRTGTFINNFVSAGSGGLDGAYGLVFGPDGNLYVCSRITAEVKRYDGTTGAPTITLGTFVSAGSGGLNNPEGLAFGPDGNLYVGSASTDSVLRYDGTTGSPTATLGTFVPAGSGGLLYPNRLVFGPDGNLYVSSAANNKVLRYHGTTGEFIGTFASGNGLIYPGGLLFGPDGNLYVSSFGTAEVKRYAGPQSSDPAPGTFINNFISAGNGGLSGPSFLIFTPAPAITCATVDTTNGCARTRTLTYTAVDSCGNSNTCTQVITWTVDTTPPSLACSSNKTVQCGEAWTFDAPVVTDDCSGTNVTLTVSDATNGVCPQVITRIWTATDLCGNTNICSQTVTVANTTPPVFTNCPASTNLGCNPVTIPGWDSNVRAIDGCGPAATPAYLLVSSLLTWDVKRYYATTGGFKDVFASGGLYEAGGLVFGPDGNLYVGSSASSEVNRYNGTTGLFLGNFVKAGSGLYGAYDMVFGPDGNLYICGPFSNGVMRYDGRTGEFMDNFVPAGSAGLIAPIGLVFGPDGNLYVSSYSTDEVIRYNGTTGAPMPTGTGNFVSAGSGGLNGPAGLAFGPDGNLYVSSRDTSEVIRYHGMTGAFMNTFVLAGRSGLSLPYGLVFGSDGDLYVSSYNTHEVKRYAGPLSIIPQPGDPIGTGTFASGGGLVSPFFLIFTPPGPLVTCAAVDTTNGCAHTRTLTYTAVDSCGNSNTCTQVITWTVDTTPPSLTCSSNKTVQCGEAWTFDAPVVTDDCSGTNVTLTFNDATNGVCPQVFTRTWTATDLCGNTNICSQTVTVANTTPPMFTNCPASTNLGCNPTFIPGWDPNVRAIDGCGPASAPAFLLVSSAYTSDVKRYYATTGVFKDIFASGHLSGAGGLVFGPDGNLYVASSGSAEVNRYDGTTGEFMGDFIPLYYNLHGPTGLTFGPDGNLYVSSLSTSEVKCYDGMTGVFLGNFVSEGRGGLMGPFGLAFGLDGNLYVSSYASDEVLRYAGPLSIDPRPGEPIGTGKFVSAGDHGLDAPTGLVFGPDGNLYVGSEVTSDVKRYDGTTGEFIDIFVSTGSGGLSASTGLRFGPDGNLYVCGFGSDDVKRYNGTTGAFIDTFASGGGLDGPEFLIFTPSAPVVTCARVDTTNGCAHTRTLTYTAVDSCGNSNTCTQVITWTVDTTPPVISASGPTLTLGCNPDAAAITAALGTATAADNCGSVTPAFTDSAVTSTGCDRSQTRTWTLTDVCGNDATPVARTVTWAEDTSEPVITSCPSSITVPSFTLVPAPNPSAVAATDDCTTSLAKTHVGDSRITNGCIVNITRTYRVSDACGNFANCTQIITVQSGSPPANDECIAAIALTAGASACGTTLCATRSFPGSLPPLCGNSANSPDVWYTFTPQCNGPVEIDTCGTCIGQVRFDTVMSVYRGGCESLVQVPGIGCSDDACGTQSHVPFEGIAGETYRIRVAGNSGVSGTFRLKVRANPGIVPFNDNVGSPTPVTIGSPAAGGSTVCATASPLGSIPIPCNDTANSPDVWFRFTPECAGLVTISTCRNGQPSLDTVLSVYQGSPGWLSQIACNNDAGGGCGSQSSVTFFGNAGVVYRIRVAGLANKAGDFQLNVSHAIVLPPNDLCANARPVGLGTDYFYTTCGANTDGPSQPGCQPNHDVWFRYVATCSGQLTVDTCGSGFNTVVSAYAGTCGNLNLIACNDDATDGQCIGSQNSRVTFNVTLGASYLIRVGGAGQATGWGRITLTGVFDQPGTCPPANGLCSTRYFMVLGPPNNAPWSWSIHAPCCANLQNLNVPGVPVGGTPDTLADAFVASINAACLNGGVMATALHIPNFPGAFTVCVKSCFASPSPFVFRIGAAGTPAENQCVVADFYGYGQLPTTGQCSFNPDMAELPQSGNDLNGNGIDDAVDIMSGESTDVDGDGVPDEAQTCLVPQLTVTPESQVVQEGDTATFTGDALGTAPLNYQWSHDNLLISGATSNVLTIPIVTLADLGDYTLTISNDCGAVTTVPVTLSTEPVALPVILHMEFFGGGFQLAFGTKVDLTYLVEYKNTLTDPAWTPLETVVGDGQEQVVADLGPLPTSRFYRVRTIAP